MNFFSTYYFVYLKYLICKKIIGFLWTFIDGRGLG